MADRGRSRSPDDRRRRRSRSPDDRRRRSSGERVRNQTQRYEPGVEATEDSLLEAQAKIRTRLAEQWERLYGPGGASAGAPPPTNNNGAVKGPPKPSSEAVWSFPGMLVMLQSVFTLNAPPPQWTVTSPVPPFVARQDFVCSICSDADKGPRPLASLTNCIHLFCPDCINQWRDTCEADYMLEYPKCPECRARIQETHVHDGRAHPDLRWQCLHCEADVTKDDYPDHWRVCPCRLTLPACATEAGKRVSATEYGQHILTCYKCMHGHLGEELKKTAAANSELRRDLASTQEQLREALHVISDLRAFTRRNQSIVSRTIANMQIATSGLHALNADPPPVPDGIAGMLPTA